MTGQKQAKSVGILLRYSTLLVHIALLELARTQGIPNNLMPFISQVATGQRQCLKIFAATMTGGWDRRPGLFARV